MSYMLPHLSNGWQVDQSILAEEDRVVLIRFGHDWDPSCMRMDEVGIVTLVVCKIHYFYFFICLMYYPSS